MKCGSGNRSSARHSAPHPARRVRRNEDRVGQRRSAEFAKLRDCVACAAAASANADRVFDEGRGDHVENAHWRDRDGRGRRKRSVRSVRGGRSRHPRNGRGRRERRYSSRSGRGSRRVTCARRGSCEGGREHLGPALVAVAHAFVVGRIAHGAQAARLRRSHWRGERRARLECHGRGATGELKVRRRRTRRCDRHGWCGYGHGNGGRGRGRRRGLR